MNEEEFRVADADRIDRLDHRYTDSWKAACREIIRVYGQVYAGGLKGDSIGAPTLRNHIMQIYDARSSQGYDGRLSLNQMSAWLSEKAGLGDLGFSFVDDFVRKLQLDDSRYEHVKKEIYRLSDENLRKAIFKTYSHGKDNRRRLSQEIIEQLNGSTYVSRALSDWRWRTPISGRQRDLEFTQIALHFSEYKLGMFSVNAIYSKPTFWSLQASQHINPKDAAHYFGYFIPEYRPQESYAVGVIHLIKQGTEGIYSIGPYTISSLSISPEEKGIDIVADWIPQMIFPLVGLFDTNFAEYSLPDINLVPPVGDRQDYESISKRGILHLSKLPDNYRFVSDYLENLTNEYIIW